MSLFTIMYWLIIIFLRIVTWILYLAMRPFRFILNFVVKKAYARRGIRIVHGESKDAKGRDPEKNGEPEESRIVDLVVKDPNLFLNMATQGSIAIGEGYMQDKWECSDIDLLMKRLSEGFGYFPNPLLLAQDWIYTHAAEMPWDDNHGASGWLTNPAKKILTRVMPEGTSFLSGYWDQHVEQETSVEPNQLAKALTRNMEILGQKLDLRPGMLVLDIRCGTGEFPLYLAKNYDIQIVGLNSSSDEIGRARKKVPEGSDIKFIQGDYKTLLPEYAERFDRIVCLDLLKQINGPQHYRNFFDTVSKYLRPDGKLLIQTLLYLKPVSLRVDLSTRKYIAGHAVTPQVKEILQHVQKGFEIENIESIGQHYKKTFSEYRNKLEMEVKGQLNAAEKKLAKVIDLSMQVIMADIDTRRMDCWQVLISKTKPVVYKPK